MSLFDWFTFGRRNEPVQASANSAPELDELLQNALGGNATSGVPVTARSALGQPTIATALRVISETVAQLPFAVYVEDDNGIAEKVDGHRLSALLGRRGKPNSWQTPFAFREQLTRDVAYRGNGFAHKVTVRGELRELNPIAAARVTVKQADNLVLTYEVAMSGGNKRIFRADEIFHVMGPSSNGFVGDDILSLMKNTFGLALAQDEDTARVFKHGARLAGVLQHPGKIGEEAAKRLKETFENIYTGVENSHKTAVLEEGMEYKTTSMTAEESQSLDSRKYQRGLIAAIWRIPPHMVGDLEKATFSNIENLARQFIDYAMMPWLERWEQTIGCQLLTDEERAAGLFVGLDVEEFLRGDSKTRADVWSKAIVGRWLNPNEIRQMQNRKPYEGGDEFINPAIQTTSDDGETEDVETEKSEDSPTE